jgi:hypothetical protein
MEVAADSALERIRLKMMAKAPASRFPKMAAVAEAIEEAPKHRRIVLSFGGK